jgi:membrane-bound serine protease (ClpP class)
VKVPFLRAFFVLLGVILALAAPAAAGSDEPAPRVLAAEFANDVNPVTEDYLTGAIERANEEGYDAVVILMDTPGGLDTSMRNIIKAQLASPVPVVVYVYPEGSRAASAGVFITMAADVAAMAPQTNIGSSTPISATGGEIGEDLRRKVVNDAAAYARALAEEHGRNGDWAERAVRVASNLAARDALEQNVVDVVAPDLPTLLEEIDGMRTQPKGLVLDTAGAEIDTISMSLWKRILDTLIDPNIIALLLSVGVLGIVVELWNPGLVFPGTVGGISLIVSLYGLQVLPVSWAGILLLLLAAGFFVAEAFVTSHGALTLAGAVCFVIGALMLFDPAGDAYQVSIWVALGIAATLATLVGLAATKIVQVRRRRPQTGTEELVGQLGVVRSPLDPTGYVFVHGELWRAHSPGGRIESGETVRVDAVGDDLVLEVTPVEARVPAPA